MSYIKFNPNPLGKTVGDCVIRAISAFLGTSWEWAYSNLAAIGFEMCDMPSSNAVWGAFLDRCGCKRKVIPNTCPFCYTVDDFCKDHRIGSYLLSTDGHVIAVIDGNYYDAWDSGSEIPLYFWFKE